MRHRAPWESRARLVGGYGPWSSWTAWKSAREPWRSIRWTPDDIDRIEVIKGEAAAGLFGDRAEGGVIRIFTRVAQPPQPEEPLTDEQGRKDPGFD